MSPPERARRSAAAPESPATLVKIRNAARKIFTEKGFFSSSVEEIATRAGVSRATVYLYFRSKDEMLFALMRQDLEFQLGLYEEMAQIRRPTKAALRRWLIAFRGALDQRRASLNLFWAGASVAPDYMASVEAHRDNIVAVLGGQFAGFDLDALPRSERELRRAKCYLMIFLIEGVSIHFFASEHAPSLALGTDLVAATLLKFIATGEIVTG
jgi:AcrR family transcriptional regulator